MGYRAFIKLGIIGEISPSDKLIMAPFLLLQLKSLQLSLILLLLGFLPSPIKGVPPSTNPTGGFTFLSSTPLHIGKFRSLTSSLYSLPNNLTASYEIVT